MRFEKHNDMLFRILDKPVPLTPDAEMPCLVRLIQDDSPMGKLNKDLHAYDAKGLMPKICTEVIDVNDLSDHNRGSVRYDGFISCQYYHYELIGTPVAEGSAEWALYHMLQGDKICNSIPEFVGYWSIVDGYCFHKHSGSRCIPDKFISLCAIKTGWQLYEQPKPLLADAKVGDLCKHRNGEWSQIIDTNGTYIPGQPIRTTLRDSQKINRNFCLSGHYFTMQVGREYDIIHWEPLAPEGTAEWAWQMLMLQKPVSHPAEGEFQDTYYTKEGFVRCMAKTGWQLYEPKEEPLLADAKVGWLVTNRAGHTSTIKYVDNNKGVLKYAYEVSDGTTIYVRENGMFNIINHNSNYDIISTEPLSLEGTAEWAWQQMLLGNKVWNPELDLHKAKRIMSQVLSIYYIDGGNIMVRNLSGERGVLGVQKDSYWAVYADPTGWQIYEPKEEPPKEPDYVICKQCGGSQSIPNPAASNTAYTTCPKCGGTGYEIKEQKPDNLYLNIKPLTPADWCFNNKNLLVLVDDNFKGIVGENVTREQVGEIAKLLTEPSTQYKVGDWVKYDIDSYLQVIEPSGKERTLCRTLSGVIVYPYTSCLTKASPSEVVIHIGCLSGKVEDLSYEEHGRFWLIGKVTERCPAGMCTILYEEMLDTHTAELVRELLKAQEEE